MDSLSAYCKHIVSRSVNSLLTQNAAQPLNFLFMEGEKPRRNVPGLPLKHRLRDKGDKAAFAAKMNESRQNITNWMRRGIPHHRFRDVCSNLGITETKYMQEAGMTAALEVAHQGRLDTAGLLEDLEALPAGLQTYLARRARELREAWEKHPILHRVFTPPRDPKAYAAWESEIDALLLKFRGGPEAAD